MQYQVELHAYKKARKHEMTTDISLTDTAYYDYAIDLVRGDPKTTHVRMTVLTVSGYDRFHRRVNNVTDVRREAVNRAEALADFLNTDRPTIQYFEYTADHPDLFKGEEKKWVEITDAED